MMAARHQTTQPEWHVVNHMSVKISTWWQSCMMYDVPPGWVPLFHSHGSMVQDSLHCTALSSSRIAAPRLSGNAVTSQALSPACLFTWSWCVQPASECPSSCGSIKTLHVSCEWLTAGIFYIVGSSPASAPLCVCDYHTLMSAYHSGQVGGASLDPTCSSLDLTCSSNAQQLMYCGVVSWQTYITHRDRPACLRLVLSCKPMIHPDFQDPRNCHSSNDCHSLSLPPSLTGLQRCSARQPGRHHAAVCVWHHTACVPAHHARAREAAAGELTYNVRLQHRALHALYCA